MSSLVNFAPIPPDPSANRKPSDFEWLFSTSSADIEALLAPHPEAFEQELDNLGLDDSLFSSLVLPDDGLGDVNTFLAHRSPHCGPGSAFTVSSDSYNDLSSHGLESLYNESLSAYGGAVSEHSLLTSDIDINLDAFGFHMPSSQPHSRSPSGEVSDTSSAYGRSSSNSLFDVPTGYENIGADSAYLQSQASSNYARRTHSGLVHRDPPSQHQARAQAHPYALADHAGSEQSEQNDPRRKYACTQCPRSFARQFNLKTHMATHDPNRTKPHVCHHSGCGRSFSRKHDLGRHLVSIHQDSERDNNGAGTSSKHSATGSPVGLASIKSEHGGCEKCRSCTKSERGRGACECDDS